MSLLSRISSLRRIGLSIDDQTMSLAVAARTPLGTRLISSKTLPWSEGTDEAVLAELLAPWIEPPAKAPGKKSKRRKRGAGPWIHVALSTAKVFQAVVPMTAANQSASSSVFFMEAVQATNVRPEDRVIDMIRIDIHKQPLACLAASLRHVVNHTAELIDNLGGRVALIEPAASAILRAGCAREKAPRGSKLQIRFFLGQSHAVGILASGQQALIYHSFAFQRDDPTSALLATYSTLWMQGRQARISLPIDAVIVHGRPDFSLSISPAAFQERTGARLRRADGPSLDSTAVATGAAMADLYGGEPRIDLSRAIKPRVPFREIIPWGEMALQAALVAGVSGFLQTTAIELDSQLKATRVELSTFPWLKDQDQAKLDKEKAAIDERITAIQTYRDTRMDWSSQLRTIATAMPSSTVIVSLQGIFESAASGKIGAGSRNQMVVNFVTPMASDGTMPHSITELIASLRAKPVLKKRFATIEVTGLRSSAATPGQPLKASYSLVCLPAAEVKPSTRPSPGAKR